MAISDAFVDGASCIRAQQIKASPLSTPAFPWYINDMEITVFGAVFDNIDM